MASTVFRFFEFSLLVFLIAAEKPTIQSPAKNPESLTPELVKSSALAESTEDSDRGGRGLLSPLPYPFFQWKLNTGPWDGLPSFAFSDPFAPLLPGSRDVEDVTDRDRESASTLTTSNPFSGFGGVFDQDHIGSIDGLQGIGNLFNVFESGPGRKPWWKGPNVCIEREQTADSTESPSDQDNGGFFSSASFNIQTCRSTDNKYECVQKISSRGTKKSNIVTYQCCLGFRRTNGEGLCVKFDLENMLNTIVKLNASDFIIRNDYETKISEGNYTIFLPNDAAFKILAEGLLQSNNIDLVNPSRRRRGINGMTPDQLVEAHIVNGFQELVPDSILHSNYHNSTLLIDRYVSANGDLQYLANCAKVLSANNYATTGMVHVIDRVLMPVTKTILQEISDNPEFSTFKQILEKTGLDKELADDETWSTVFVPTNDAFAQLDENIRGLIMNGDTTSKNIVKSHFIDPVLCSSLVENGGAIGVINANGDKMTLSTPNITETNELNVQAIPTVSFLVNNITVIRADILATHGVIHVISDVIIPESALSFMKVLEKENLTAFRDIILQANMADEVDSLSNVTFFIPTNEAIESQLKISETSEVASLLAGENPTTAKPSTMDKKRSRAFVLHHTIKGLLPSYEMENNMVKTTLLPDPLRVNLYSTVPIFTNTYNRATANCAKVVKFSLQQRSNLIHLVDRPVPKQADSIMQLIRMDPELTTLTKILEGTGLERALETMQNITFLAPRNNVFSAMSKEEFEKFSTDKEFADYQLSHRVVKGILCCAALHEKPWPFTSTIKNLAGQSLAIHNNRIGAAVIDKCDLVAENGVLHHSSSLLMTSLHRRSAHNPNVDIFLYGI